MPATLEKPRASNVTIKLDSIERDRLRSLSVAKKRTPHYLMKEAIALYLEREENEQAVLSIVDNSAHHYEATGLHITMAEMRLWKDAVKADRTVKLPTCHA